MEECLKSSKPTTSTDDLTAAGHCPGIDAEATTSTKDDLPTVKEDAPMSALESIRHGLHNVKVSSAYGVVVVILLLFYILLLECLFFPIFFNTITLFCHDLSYWFIIRYTHT